MKAGIDEILAAIDNAIFNINDVGGSIKIKLQYIDYLIKTNQKLEYIIIGLLAITIIGIIAVLWNQHKIKKQLKKLLEEKEQDKP